MMEYTANQPLEFKSSPNIRELGGYYNTDGIRLRENKFLRAGDISQLDEAEQKRLIDYGIKICIDLRRVSEKKTPDFYELNDNTAYLAFPIAGEVAAHKNADNILYELYIDILENHKDVIYQVFTICAMMNEGILFHCSAGKDRTGLIAMLILAVCGVSAEQIVADYKVSGDNNREVSKTQKKMLIQLGLADVPDELFESDESNMIRLLDYLNEKYGGVINYLKSTGVTGHTFELLRKKMLEV